jgi:hypothetical protein
MQYDRTIIAYHGCDAETADRLLRGEPFKKSQNDFTDELPLAFEMYKQLHRQSEIAVRNPACVLGVFRPTMKP